MKAYQVDVIIKPWEEGGYMAEAPTVQGCWVVAPDVTAAMEQIVGVVKMHLEIIGERGEALPDGVLQVSTGPLKARVAISVP